MSDQLITSVVTVLTAIVGVAIIAVLVSNKAQTGQVIGAGGNAFSQALSVAVSPVTGGGSFTSQGFGYGGVSDAPTISY
jgi:hypothetical protein